MKNPVTISFVAALMVSRRAQGLHAESASDNISQSSSILCECYFLLTINVLLNNVLFSDLPIEKMASVQV